MKIELFKSGKVGDWYFRIVASNGQIVAQSEGYRNRMDCLSTINSLQINLSNAGIYQDGVKIL